MTSVAQNLKSFRYASEELQRDKEVVMSVVTRDGMRLQYVSEKTPKR